MWPTCVDLSCAVEMCSGEPQGLPTPPSGADAANAPRDEEQQGLAGNSPKVDVYNGGGNIEAEVWDTGKERSVIDKYARFRQAVARMGLERAWDMAPLLRVSEDATYSGIFVDQVLSPHSVDTLSRRRRLCYAGKQSSSESVIASECRRLGTHFRRALSSQFDLSAACLQGNELVAELNLPKGPEIGKQMAKQVGVVVVRASRREASRCSQTCSRLGFPHSPLFFAKRPSRLASCNA